MKNFYEILRVRTNASTEQIKKAFIELVSVYHPDIYKGDKLYAEQYTAILTEAYATLKDPEKRLEYDIKNNINSRPTRRQLRREDFLIKKEKLAEKRMTRKNYEQEMSMKYFKNTERKKPKKNFLLKLLTSKFLYCTLFIILIEILVILFIYSR